MYINISSQENSLNSVGSKVERHYGNVGIMLMSMRIETFSRVRDKDTMKTAYLLMLAIFGSFFSMGDSFGIGE